jgi:hypothetical protein
MNAQEWETVLLDGCYITSDQIMSAKQVAEILAEKDAKIIELEAARAACRKGFWRRLLGA